MQIFAFPKGEAQFVKKRGRGGALLRPWPFAM